MSLIITNTAGSLGDWLSLTPLLAAKPGLTVLAKDSPHTRRFAVLYEGLAKVEFTNQEIRDTPATEENLCFSKRILNYYGLSNVSAIPVVKLKQEEIEWAREFLSAYENPVVFNNTVAAARRDKPDTDMCNYRRLPDKLTESLIKTLKSQGKTLLKFGTKTIQTNIYNNFDEVEGVENIIDLDLRSLAACYHVIGNYVGTATGDMHLMLAVGGRCSVHVPPDAWHYSWGKHHYYGSAWKNEEIRAIYHPFQVIDTNIL